MGELFAFTSAQSTQVCRSRVPKWRRWRGQTEDGQAQECEIGTVELGLQVGKEKSKHALNILQVIDLGRTTLVAKPCHSRLRRFSPS
jgi:hypothetical protein